MSKVSIKDYPYVLKHLNAGGCGEDPLYIDHMPLSGEISNKSKNYMNTDGSKPLPGTCIVCSNCGEILWPRDMKTKNVFDRRELKLYDVLTK